MFPLSKFPSTDFTLLLGYKLSLARAAFRVELSSIPRSLFPTVTVFNKICTSYFNSSPDLFFSSLTAWGELDFWLVVISQPPYS